MNLERGSNERENWETWERIIWKKTMDILRKLTEGTGKGEAMREKPGKPGRESQSGRKPWIF